VEFVYDNVEQAIFMTQLFSLSLLDDSLVVRKLGTDSAREIRMRAHALLQEDDEGRSRAGVLEFDAYLRSDGHKRNPGTTADLIAAALFVAMRERKISLGTPFPWRDHPFATGA
jgi:triphosphoribosyl-dephospho-CoA synthase